VLELIGEPTAVLLIGAGGGLLLGLAARLGKLCTLGMIEDVHYGQDYGRLWMWLTVLGTAMILNFGADALGLIDLSTALQLSNRYSILGVIVGGLLFGYGMAQAGNCGYGVLARLGGGDIRALMIALVMGVTASAALFGILGGMRPTLFPVTPAGPEPSGLAHSIQGMTGLPHTAIGLTLGMLALLLSIRLQAPGQRLRRAGWGIVAGGAISSGFLGTYWVASSGFDAWSVVSHSFTSIGCTFSTRSRHGPAGAGGRGRVSSWIGLLLRQPLIVSFIAVGILTAAGYPMKSVLDIARSDEQIDLLAELGSRSCFSSWA
jgi:hypothetical protein